jgi:hypothetical protein
VWRSASRPAPFLIRVNDNVRGSPRTRLVETGAKIVDIQMSSAEGQSRCAHRLLWCSAESSGAIGRFRPKSYRGGSRELKLKPSAGCVPREE